MNPKSSDRSKDATSYHHGNLRLALLEAALEQIKEQGAEKLSLRGLARAVGVSQTAPYRHFEDKNQLLAELATQAFKELSEATSGAVYEGDPAADNIARIGNAYRVYAIANPEKYKLMFGPVIQDRNQYPDLYEAGNQAFHVLIDTVTAGVDNKELIGAPPELMAHMLWSVVHGASSLAIDGFYENRPLPLDFESFMRSLGMLATRAIKADQSENIPAFPALKSPSSAP